MVAVTVPHRSSGELRVPRDRKGRLKPRRVDLTVQSPSAAAADVAPGDLNWLLGAERRAWSSATARFGPDAWDIACEVARAGLLEIRCAVTGAELAEPIALLLTQQGLARRDERTSARAATAAQWKARAEAAAQLVAPLDPALADALRRGRGADTTLQVLVFAAEDLTAGRIHDGPRAFSQTHFGHTKQRDDVPAILRAAGAAPETLAALGVERSPYLGLGGAIHVSDIDLSGLRGPVLFRANDPALHGVRAAIAVRALVVVENLQAAENVCDTRTDVAVAYSAGQPSDAALGVIAALAADTARVLVVPDADLGGVRIAERILDALPPDARVQLVDVGEQPHERREPFAPLTMTALKACSAGRASRLAKAVLARSYPVEQEAATRAAVMQALAKDPLL